MISQTQFFLERYEYYRDKLLAYNMDTPIEKIGDLTDVFQKLVYIEMSGLPKEYVFGVPAMCL